MKFDIDTIIKLINGVGFPIVVCIALFWTQQTSMTQQTALLSEFKSTIQNNTEALNRISNQLHEKGGVRNDNSKL